MSSFLFSSTLKSLGVQISNKHTRGPVVYGVTIVPVRASELCNVINMTSGRAIDAREAVAILEQSVIGAAESVEAHMVILSAELKRLRSTIAKDGTEAAIRADTRTLAGIADDVSHALQPRHETQDEKDADVLAELMDDGETDYLGDLTPIRNALSRLNDARQKVASKVADLHGLAGQLASLHTQATDPATTAAIRAHGQEISLRNLIPGVSAHVRRLHAQAQATADELAKVLATLEAVQ